MLDREYPDGIYSVFSLNVGNIKNTQPVRFILGNEFIDIRSGWVEIICVLISMLWHSDGGMNSKKLAEADIFNKDVLMAPYYTSREETMAYKIGTTGQYLEIKKDPKLILETLAKLVIAVGWDTREAQVLIYGNR